MLTLLRSIYLLQIAVFGIIYYLRNKGYSVDDSFITYRYAYNLKEGFGLVFNVGENYYGTTAAGYAVFLAVISSALDVIFRVVTNGGDAPTIPNVSVAISALSLCFIAVCLPFVLQAGRVVLRWVVCAIFVAYLFVGYPFNEVAGHETYAFLAFAFLASVLAESRQSALAGCILGIAATFRPDAVLLAPILVLLVWGRSREGWRNYLASRGFRHFCFGFAAIIIPWMIYLWVHFGQLIPGTLDAKRAQVGLADWPIYNLINLLKYLTATGFSVLLVMGVGLLAVVWLVAKQQDRGAFCQDRGLFITITWLLYGLGSACAYFLFNVTFWPWYGVPVFFSLGIGSLIGWRIVLDQFSIASDRFIQRKMLANCVYISPVIILGLVSLSAPQNFFVWYGSPNVNPHIHAYEEISRYLKLAEPDGTSIQMCEPGSFGFGLGPKFRIIDELGLITPGVAKALLHGDYDYANRTYKAKYLVCSCKLEFLECSKLDLFEQFKSLGEADVAYWGPRTGSGAVLLRRININ